MHSTYPTLLPAYAMEAPGPPESKLKFCVYVVQAQLTDLLIPKLSGRPADQEKARRAKQGLQRKVEAELAPLQAWMAGGYVGFDILSAEQHQLVAGTPAGQGQWAAGALSPY